MRILPLRLAVLGTAWLTAVLAAPASAQPVDRDLPAGEVLEIELWNADLRIAVRPGVTPHLVARAVAIPGDAATEAALAGRPTVEVREQGRGLKVLRAADSEDARLRVEAVLDPGRDIRIVGAELDVSVAGSGSPVSLTLENSRAELAGVRGGVFVGRDSWLVSRQSSGELSVRLQGGGAELATHRGKLVLRGEDGEIRIREARGAVECELRGGRVEVAESAGKLTGKVRRGAVLRLVDWGGDAFLEASGAVLDLRNFGLDLRTLKVKAKDSDVVIEALRSATLELAQEGGELRLRDLDEIAGKITTSLAAKVEVSGISGSWTGVFQDSEVTIESAERLDAELYNSTLELAGARDLSLIAHGSRIRASEVERISGVHLVTTTADLELTAGSRAEVMVQGLSRATLRLPRPCFVLVEPSGSSAGEALDVAGCTLGAAPEDAEDDAGGVSFLRGTVGGGSVLTVREAF